MNGVTDDEDGAGSYLDHDHPERKDVCLLGD